MTSAGCVCVGRGGGGGEGRRDQQKTKPVRFIFLQSFELGMKFDEAMKQFKLNLLSMLRLIESREVTAKINHVAHSMLHVISA